MKISDAGKAPKPDSTLTDGFNLYKEFNNGGCIEIINGYIKKSDHKDLLSISRSFAIKGKKVQITTEIHYKDEKYEQIFGTLTETIYARKCPDLIIDGKFYEYESFIPPFNKGKIAHMISKGTKQSSRIIINNTKGCSDRYILNNIGNRLHDKSFKNVIEEVWVYEKGKTRKIW
ncbi:hypothetical protein FACS189440_12450 [Bacteroidia bacterium]|nr:hypothetical protein FACS189423_04530 [Bacteroidia bacterium]GHT48541.1 hypothetical protein FACS189440_12450 [Bacteroidia bacterium]